MKSDADPRLSLTEVDAADPFESTDQRVSLDGGVAPTDLPTARRPTPMTATAAESDPATALVRHVSFVDLPPGSIVGEIYEIDAKLGAGAMGEVYAARHLKLGKRVAIKVIGPRLSEDAAAIERFAQEARTLARVQHPAIVAVDHVGDLADGRAFFVMELLKGESLYERLQRGRIPLPEALRILDQMARGLEAAHAQGVTHRDLKPENTFLARIPGEAPIVKLLDFGLVKLARDVDQRAERTQSGVAIGTPMYMSPEQARGAHVDHRTDIYALGAIAYELLLGASPFPHARSVPELYAAHLHEAPPLPRSIWPEIPPQLDLMLFAMLAKDAAYRPTLAQVRSVLIAARTSTPSQRAATEFVAPRVQGGAKTKTAVIAAGTLIVGMLIGALMTCRQSDEPAKSTSISVPAAVPAPIKNVPITAPTAMIDGAPETTAANMGSGAASAAPRSHSIARTTRPAPVQRVGSAAPVVSHTPDGGVDVAPVTGADDAGVAAKKMATRPSPPIDRNQILSPFPPKPNKVTP